MSESNAISAFGTLLRREDPVDSGTYVTIGEVRSISGPGLKLDTKEITHMESTGAWEEVLGTILRSGEVSAEVGFIPNDANQVALINDMKARGKKRYRIVFPNVAATTWTFKALVTGFEPSANFDEDLTATVTFKPSGQPTLP